MSTQINRKLHEASDKTMKHREANRRYRLAHPEKVRESKAKWAKTNPDKVKEHRRKFRESHPEVAREWTEKNREKVSIMSRAWAIKNPEKRKAHMVIHHLIEDGKLSKQPCEICGNINTHAHHADYSKPLNVNWLCAKHHMEVHYG